MPKGADPSGANGVPLGEVFAAPDPLDEIRRALGRIELRQLQDCPSCHLHDYEFKVYSQSGEDGIIQYLIRRIEIANPVFVEIGVGNYTEANTRFLAVNNHWTGLVIDCSGENIDQIRRSRIFWECDLKVECAFVDSDNVNAILLKHGIQGDIGLLSIDIDGNDYWIWKALTCVSPRIVICEYNSLFGSKRKVTIPYDKDFRRIKAHYSSLYFGASIAALADLGEKKGYVLAGSNSVGTNLFFVRNDLALDIPRISPDQAYVKIKFRQSLDREGRLTFLDFSQSQRLIADMPVYDLDLGHTVPLADLTEAPEGSGNGTP